MEIITSFQIAIQDQFYKMIYISFRDDGSIHVIFPRKKGYVVSEEIDLPEKIVGTQTFELQPNNSKVYNPYISYHPRNNSIHINSDFQNRYKQDSKILNLSEDKKIIGFPLCQIIISDFSFFDLIHKQKYVSPHIIDVNKIPKGPLSIEFWVLPVGMYLEKEDLPFYKKRIEDTNFIGITRFQNQELKKFSITAVLSTLKKDVSSEKNHHCIIIAIFNNEHPFVYKLLPIGQ